MDDADLPDEHGDRVAGVDVGDVAAGLGWPPGARVGLELLARQHDEARLLRLGAAIERVTRQRLLLASALAGHVARPGRSAAGT